MHLPPSFIAYSIDWVSSEDYIHVSDTEIEFGGRNKIIKYAISSYTQRVPRHQEPFIELPSTRNLSAIIHEEL